ncbi:hypothetical protein AALB39_03905 [Lachnospiraceae bacterium 54-53]
MTYKEAYMKCETLKELNEMVSKDIKWALVINKDRIDIIKAAAYDVCEEKDWWD